MNESRKQLIGHFLSRNRWIVILAMVAALLNSLLNVVLPLSIGKFFDLAFQDNSAKGKLIERTGLHIEDLSSFFMFFFLIVIMRGIFGFIELYLMEIIEENFTFYLRKKLFEKQLSHTQYSFQSKPVSKYLLRYSSDMSAIRNYLTKGHLKFISDSAFLIFALLMLAQLNSTLTMVVFITLLASALIIIFFTRIQNNANDNRQNSRASFLQFVESRLSSFFTIKVFNREAPESQQFEKRSRSLRSSNLKYALYTSLIQSFLPLAFFTAIGIVLIESIPQNTLSTTEVSGYLLVFILIMLYMQSVFKRLMRVPSILSQGRMSLDNLTQILNLPSEKKRTDTEEEFIGNISMKHLYFGFEQNPKLLVDFNAEFPFGQITCVTGTAGSGKSTLLKLMTGFYTAERGQIYLDDKNLNDIAPHIIRKNISVVSNEAPLLGKTVFRAISYSRKEEKRQSAKDMLTKLGIRLKEDPDENLDFAIGIDSNQISGQTKIMLQFARAFLTRKKILLLDEPFSNLDQNGIDTISAQLLSLKSKRTIIILSSTIPNSLKIDNVINL